MGWFVSSLSKAVSAVAEKQALKDAVQHPPAKRHEAKRLIDEIHQLISFRVQSFTNKKIRHRIVETELCL